MTAIRTHAATAGLVLVGAGVILTGSAGVALAERGPNICHPVEGNGETGYGWNLISPDKASVHIDEASGEGKHTRKDGRTDVYADGSGHCPGYVPPVTSTPTPSPSPSDVPPTPTPTPTESTPEPSDTPTLEPTPEPSPTETTPEPSPTQEPTPDPSPTVTATVAPKPTKAPVASSTTAPEPETAPVARRAELAQTGAAETFNLICFGLLLVAIGAGVVTLARRNNFPTEDES